jgi:hypothetical protein
MARWAAGQRVHDRHALHHDGEQRALLPFHRGAHLHDVLVHRIEGTDERTTASTSRRCCPEIASSPPRSRTRASRRPRTACPSGVLGSGATSSLQAVDAVGPVFSRPREYGWREVLIRRRGTGSFCAFAVAMAEARRVLKRSDTRAVRWPENGRRDRRPHKSGRVAMSGTINGGQGPPVRPDHARSGRVVSRTC